MKWLYSLEKNFTLNIKTYLSDSQITQWKKEVLEIRKLKTPEKKNRRILLELYPDLNIKIRKNYTWDGNSPKWSFFDLFWWGTPEGKTFKNVPATYHASLVHDCLGQLKDDDLMPSIFKKGENDGYLAKGRKQRDRLFYLLLKDKDFFWAEAYWLVIKLIGPIYDKQKEWTKGVRTENGKAVLSFYPQNVIFRGATQLILFLLGLTITLFVSFEFVCTVFFSSNCFSIVNLAKTVGESILSIK